MKKKKKKGITLIYLIITIIALTLTTAFLAMVSQNFYKNTNYLSDTSTYIVEYNKFNAFFILDVKNNDSATVSDTEIKFKDGVSYTYSDNKIYRDNVRICRNITDCNFSTYNITVNNTEKQIISVYITIDQTSANGEDELVLENDYVLRYW